MPLMLQNLVVVTCFARFVANELEIWNYAVICCRFKFSNAIVTFPGQITSCLVGCLSCNLGSHLFIIFTVFQSHLTESFDLAFPRYLSCWLCLHPAGLNSFVVLMLC